MQWQLQLVKIVCLTGWPKKITVLYKNLVHFAQWINTLPSFLFLYAAIQNTTFKKPDTMTRKKEKKAFSEQAKPFARKGNMLVYLTNQSSSITVDFAISS